MTARALRSADLSQAQSALMVANSPLFLLRQIRQDPFTAQIAREAKGAVIFDVLRDSLQREPRALRNAVAPYVYLVALSMQDDATFLKHATALPAPHHEWFSFICDFLLKTYRSDTIQTLVIPASLNTSSNVATTAIACEFQTETLPKTKSKGFKRV